MRSAGLLYGNNPHYLDHLAPLCSLLDIPLILDDEQITEEAKLFYPDVKFRKKDPILLYEEVVHEYDQLFVCTPRPFFDLSFFLAQKLQNKRIDTIWCPHGHSDKGKTIFFFEGLSQEKTILTYGKTMEIILKEKKIRARQIKIGNYRYLYYQKHRYFYKKLMKKYFHKKQKTILFAPTWNDYEGCSCYKHAILPLLDHLSDDTLLIIKLHPNFQSDRYELGKYQEKKKSNLLILNRFHPIYPLLELSDVLITDKSSIGYDFLAFNRPLFFPYSPFPSPIDRCGIPMNGFKEKNPYHFMNSFLPTDKKNFSHIRRSIYKNAFEQDVDWIEIRQNFLRRSTFP